MKSIRIFALVMLVGILAAGCSQETPMTTSPEQQAGYDKDGTEELGVPSIAIADGSGFAEGGTGMGNTDTGNFDVTVPAGATVAQALLYWAGGTTGDDGDDTISVNGNPVTGTLIGGPTNFFENYDFYAYRADITGEGWVGPGVNSFEITDFDFDFSGSTLDENHGCSILVIYDDGTMADLSLFDGLDCAYFNFAAPLDATVPKTFTFTAESADRMADLIVFSGSVGVDRPNQIKVTTTAGDQVFDNPLFGNEGPQWDALTLEVNVPAGATELTVELISVNSTDPRGASMTWIGTGLAVPVNPLYCIGDYVWLDADCNGCQDEGEMGVEGVEVNLWVGCPPQEVIATTMTDADGHYEFCDLMPGDYTVQFVAPDGHVFTEQYSDGCGMETDSNPGEDGITECVTLVDADDMTIDAGLCAVDYCIGDKVWYDADCNGCQDEGERGAMDVEVNLWVGCPPQEVIATTMTDADGHYEFCGLMPGDYTVQFVAPDGHVFSEQYAGGCGMETDSNPGSDGITECVTIVDADDWTIDAGLCMPEQDGCTLTIGFWKNHAGFGPQDDVLSQYLPIWLGDDTGAKSLPVTTAAIAVDVLKMKTYGKNNNGITKLYAQLLAAKLNFAAGASDDDVADYVTDADAFLADHDWMDWDSLSDDDKDMVMMWQGMFDDYNNGDIGPGHCDDDDDDDEDPVYFK